MPFTFDKSWEMLMEEEADDMDDDNPTAQDRWGTFWRWADAWRCLAQPPGRRGGHTTTDHGPIDNRCMQLHKSIFTARRRLSQVPIKILVVVVLAY